MSEQHLTYSYQAQDVEIEPGEIMSYDRAGRPWGRSIVGSHEKQEAKKYFIPRFYEEVWRQVNEKENVLSPNKN